MRVREGEPGTQVDDPLAGGDPPAQFGRVDQPDGERSAAGGTLPLRGPMCA